MSQAKRQMEDNEEKRVVAREVLTRCKKIEECEHHDDWTQQVDDDLGSAYGHATNLLNQNDPLVSIFRGNRQELLDTIKNVFDELSDEDCHYCAKMLDE